MSKQTGIKGKRQEIKARRLREQQRTRLITLSVVGVFAVLIAAVVIATWLGNRVTGDFIIPQVEPLPISDRNTMGDPNAPIRIEEFSDFLCSHCKAFAVDQKPAIVRDYIETGKVFFVYIPFSFMAPESARAAEAAYCAADQDKFWQYHNIIFANVGTETTQPLADERLIQYAEALGLDVDTFRTCLLNDTHQRQVQDDLAYGRGLGVTGTPTFNLNGRLFSRGEIVQVIEEELARLSQ